MDYVASLEEVTCPENSTVKCRRFSTHGAMCVNKGDRWEIDDKNQLDWDLNTIRKETDKCFKYANIDDTYRFVANNAADISYVLYSETKNMHSKNADLGTLIRVKHKSPYCTFTINDEEHQHLLYDSDRKILEKPEEPPTVKMQASGTDVQCCVNDYCTEGSTDEVFLVSNAFWSSYGSSQYLELYSKTYRQ